MSHFILVDMTCFKMYALQNRLLTICMKPQITHTYFDTPSFGAFTHDQYVGWFLQIKRHSTELTEKKNKNCSRNCYIENGKVGVLPWIQIYSIDKKYIFWIYNRC